MLGLSLLESAVVAAIDDDVVVRRNRFTYFHLSVLTLTTNFYGNNTLTQ